MIIFLFNSHHVHLKLIIKHLISLQEDISVPLTSLIMCLLVRGRSNLSLTCDRPIANLNNPTNLSNQAPAYCSGSRSRFTYVITGKKRLTRQQHTVGPHPGHSRIWADAMLLSSCWLCQPLIYIIHHSHKLFQTDNCLRIYKFMAYDSDFTYS